MNRVASVLLACVALVGCQPGVIDALAAPSDAGAGGMSGSTQAAGGGGAHAGGAPDTALAYFSFDEGTGSTVHDESGNGHDGQLLGGTWADPGRFGSALRFGATGSGVLVDPFPQPTKDWSVSFWLFVNGADLTGVSTVLSTEVTFAGGWEVNVQPKDSALGNLEFAYWVGSEYAKATCDCIRLGAWTHIVAVVDGTAQTIQLYQDDIPSAPAKASAPFMPGNPYLYLGRWGGTDRPLVGALDEVAIFDRALSTAEVAQLNAGVVP